MFGPEINDENQQAHITKITESLAHELKGAGCFKPPNSWSWFLETDDSEIMNWCFQVGLSKQPLTGQQKILEKIDAWIGAAFHK